MRTDTVSALTNMYVAENVGALKDGHVSSYK
jgi:hypothetical protein